MLFNSDSESKVLGFLPNRDAKSQKNSRSSILANVTNTLRIEGGGVGSEDVIAKRN